jgi:hypothetical protein
MYEFEQINGGYYVTELGISMQMWLNLYVTPDLGDPSTWEDERKKYSKTKKAWQEVADYAKSKAEALSVDIDKYQQYEAEGLTYSEVTLRTTGQARSEVSDNPYDASEDLMFLYGAIRDLYEFIFEVRCLK